MSRSSLIYLFFAVSAFAQTGKIVNVTYNAKLSPPCLSILFDTPIVGAAPQVTVHDSNQNEVSHQAPTIPFGGNKSVRVCFNAPAPKNLSDVVLPSVNFGGAAPQTNMSFAVTTGPESVIGLMQKVAQTQSEKNIFASGLVTTASTGTAGAGDVNLNSPNILGSVLGGGTNAGLLSGFLQIKRSTTTAGDPKNFEAGIKYQAGIGLGDKASSTITAVLLDLAAKTEGTASQFGVNNLVGDTSVGLQSPVWGRNANFSAKLRLVAGMEGGSNQSKGNAPTDLEGFGPLKNVDWIARGKFGFQGALKYLRDEQHPQVPFDSLEMTAGVVDRYLIFDELRFNQTTNAVDTTAHGNRPWAQLDLKLMVGHNDSASYGLKLTYERGSLPPVFAQVKTFQFGFVYETKDRTDKK